MRLLLTLVFGAIVGAVGVLVFFMLDTEFEPDKPDQSGGGNVRVSFDSDALELMILRELETIDDLPGERAVEVTVRDDGLIDVEIVAGTGGIGLKGTVVINPNVVDGRLALTVEEAKLGELPVPDAFVPLLEDTLARTLDSVADGFEYRLLAIITRDNILTLEIDF
ncbi:MAG: hypothetical protein ACSLFM_10900 [Tepidiformaceae bacterium]